MEEQEDCMISVSQRKTRLGRIGALLSWLALVALIVSVLPAASTLAQTRTRTFTETGKSIKGKFLDYWEANGGLTQQGFPISDEMQETSALDGKTRTVQYFERAVFELHPENAGTKFEVLLSQLGTYTYRDRYGKVGVSPAKQRVSTDNPRKFSETGKTLGGKFRAYWEKNGGLAQQGFPISEEFQEKSLLDAGKTYTVQYFERAVFELHPENAGTPYEVLLVQLGRFSYTDLYQGPKYPGGAATLNGAGSTFVNPIMSKWTKDYNTLYPDVKINYQSIGSGGGRQQFIAKTVDFGASDAPLSDAQLEQAGGAAAVLHIPVAMGGVVAAYNINGAPQSLKLTGDVIANIFLGTVTNWNDASIKALNPGVTLPDQPIVVIHRSEGSGTTDIFTDYLSKVSSEWKTKVGRGTSVQWPLGIGAQGNEGVTNAVKNTSGGIGYIEVGYAKANNLPYAVVKNAAGNFVEPTAANVAEAAASLIDTAIPNDLRYSITNAPGPNAYPISGTVWVLVYKGQADANKGRVLAYFLWWASHKGQDYSEDLFYAPLPAEIIERVNVAIKEMRCGSEPCFK